MEENGTSFDAVLEELQARRRRDFSYERGEILGSMCTAPHPVAQAAYQLFMETNLGDPAHFPGTRALEREYVDGLLDLTHAPEGAEGLFLSGGTESNIVAVAAAVQAWRARHPDAALKGRRPNLVVASTGHFSFEKAAKLTDVEVRHAAVDDRWRLRVEDDPDGRSAADLVDEDTCLLVAVTGNTEFGAVDPVVPLAGLAARHGLPLHVDAALGGFILPFLPLAGRAAEPWDFAVDAVTSITMDPHKMGGSTIPGGILLVRDATWLDHVAVATPYVTTDRQSGILGTRPGAGAAAAWAVAKHLGRRGYESIAARCLADASWFRDQLDAAGLDQHVTDLNVVLVRHPHPRRLQEALSRRGWRVNVVPQHQGIRIVVMPHVERHALEAFLPDLVELAAELEDDPSPTAEDQASEGDDGAHTDARTAGARA